MNRDFSVPDPSPLASNWTLDREICFLNHGSFGACPKKVLEEQSAWRARMEREPVTFFVEQLFPALDQVRARVAQFVNCDPDDLVFVPNATTGVAISLANLDLGPGDEVLINPHEYPACQNNAARVAEQRGATVVNAPLPFPVRSTDEAADAILSRVTDKTRVCLLSHITSPTALVLPVDRLVPELQSRGIDVIVDGAHAPGSIHVDIKAIDPVCYTANCHKWPCAPKGAAFLYVRKDRQEGFRPAILSNDALEGRPNRQKFHLEFDYVGTNDYTPALSIPCALDTMGEMVEGGWDAIRAHNHDLALAGRDILCEKLSIEPPAPDDMIPAIATVVLPSHSSELNEKLAARPTRHHDALQDALIDRHGIQVPVWPVFGMERRFLRISAQLYNSLEQYAYLAEALAVELEAERALG